MPSNPLGEAIHRLRLALGQNEETALPDAQLLADFTQRQDEASFALLVRRHGPLVMGACRRITGDRHDAEDAFQAVFLVLARKAAGLVPHRPLAGWLYGVAHKTALKVRAATMKRRARERQVRTMPEPAAAEPTSWSDLHPILDQELSLLPQKYRLPVILCDLEGKTQKKAAAQLKCPEKTLATRLTRARALLAKRLTRHGFNLSASAVTAMLAETTASAKVPPGLVMMTAKAASAFVTGAAGAVSVKVVALAEGVSSGMAVGKLKLVLAVVMSVALAVGGVGWAKNHGQVVEVQAQSKHETQAKEPEKKDLAGASGSKEQVRVDAYGDPMPDGAVARLGTTRFRHYGEARALSFTPDSKTLIGMTRSFVILWDAKTGKERNRLRIPLHSSLFESDGIGVSPDGSTLALPELIPGKIEVMVGLWDIKQGKQIRVISLEREKDAAFHQISCLSFSPNGKTLGVGFRGDGKLAMVNLESGKADWLLGGRNSDGSLKAHFYNFAFSPDGKTLAGVISRHGGAHLVHSADIATGKLLRTLYEPESDEEYVRSLAYSPDGKLLAIGTDNRITLVDPVLGTQVGRLNAPKAGQITGVAFTPDGRKLVSGSEDDGRIRIWDLATSQAVHMLDGRMFLGRSMAMSPDGKTVALGAVGNAIRLWDIESGNERFTNQVGHDSQINCLAFSPDESMLVSGGDFRQTFLWDTTTWQRTSALPVSAQTLSFSPAGRVLAIVPKNSSMVRIWDVASTTEESVLTIPYAKNVEPAAARDAKELKAATFSVDGRKLFTLDWDRNRQARYRLGHWNLATGALDQSWDVPFETHTVALAPDGKSIFAAIHSHVSIFDAVIGREQRLSGWDSESTAIIMPSADGRLLAVGLWHGQRSYKANTKHPVFHVIEVATGKEIFHVDGLQGCQGPVAWSNDGRLIAFQDAGGDPYTRTIENTVRVLDAARGEEVKRFANYDSAASALVFSPSGKYLAAGMANTTILVWDVAKLTSKKAPEPILDNSRLEELWKNLLVNNAGEAHNTLGAFVESPTQSVRYLKTKLNPVAIANAGVANRWLNELNSETFGIRQSAEKELVKLGGQVAAKIQQSMNDEVPLETRRRFEQILNNIFSSPHPETLRTIRAIMVLERIGTPEAKTILETLATGAPGARETEEARASLERLKARMP